MHNENNASAPAPAPAALWNVTEPAPRERSVRRHDRRLAEMQEAWKVGASLRLRRSSRGSCVGIDLPKGITGPLVQATACKLVFLAETVAVAKEASKVMRAGIKPFERLIADEFDKDARGLPVCVEAAASVVDGRVEFRAESWRDGGIRPHLGRGADGSGFTPEESRGLQRFLALEANLDQSYSLVNRGKLVPYWQIRKADFPAFIRLLIDQPSEFAVENMMGKWLRNDCPSLSRTFGVVKTTRPSTLHAGLIELLDENLQLLAYMPSAGEDDAAVELIGRVIDEAVVMSCDDVNVKFPCNVEGWRQAINWFGPAVEVMVALWATTFIMVDEDYVYLHDGLLSPAMRHALFTEAGNQIVPYFDVRSLQQTELQGFYIAGSLGALKFEIDQQPAEWNFHNVCGMQLDLRVYGCRRPEEFPPATTPFVPPVKEEQEPIGSPVATS